jgi:hypothetical protein
LEEVRVMDLFYTPSRIKSNNTRMRINIVNTRARIEIQRVLV